MLFFVLIVRYLEVIGYLLQMVLFYFLKPFFFYSNGGCIILAEVIAQKLQNTLVPLLYMHLVIQNIYVLLIKKPKA